QAACPELLGFLAGASLKEVGLRRLGRDPLLGDEREACGLALVRAALVELPWAVVHALVVEISVEVLVVNLRLGWRLVLLSRRCGSGCLGAVRRVGLCWCRGRRGLRRASLLRGCRLGWDCV